MSMIGGRESTCIGSKLNKGRIALLYRGVLSCFSGNMSGSVLLALFPPLCNLLFSVHRSRLLSEAVVLSVARYAKKRTGWLWSGCWHGKGRTGKTTSKTLALFILEGRLEFGKVPG